MSNKKPIDYDYGGSISYSGSLMNICALLAGFTFTGIMVVLTSLGNPGALFSQITLAILVVALGSFIIALWELQDIITLTCIHSPKPIIYRDAARWRIIGMTLWLSTILLTMSITVMFLLKNLIILFIFSLIVMAAGNIWSYFNSYKPTKKELDNYYAQDPHTLS
ncbi:hypothetical protein [[Eubacterium] cellulosolvens]